MNCFAALVITFAVGTGLPLRIHTAPQATVDSPVVVIYTNHVSEAITPCGCGEATGGAARRGTVIAKARRSGALVLPVDGGNLVSAEADGGMSRFAAIVDAMNRMGYAAATLGLREVALGRFFIERYRGLARFPIVSANVELDSGAPLPDSVAVGEERRVFITGVSSAETTGYGVTVSDPVRAVRRVARALPRGALLVVLAHVEPDVARAVARSLLRPALVLGYATPRTDLRGASYGQARVGGMANEGRSVLVARWSRLRRGGWRMDDYEVMPLVEKIAEDPAVAAALAVEETAP